MQRPESSQRPGPPLVPFLPPDARHRGVDASGRVGVEINGAATDVGVTLERGWRAIVRPPGLGAAVLQGFSAAGLARLTAWAESRRGGDVGAAGATRPTPPAQPPRPQPVTHEVMAALARARRDIAEFQRRLTELHTADHVVGSPGREVVVTVRGGQIVGVELDVAWRRTATDTELERAIRAALNAALARIAALPTEAMQGCPDLQAVLADVQIPQPFPLPGPAATAVVPA